MIIKKRDPKISLRGWRWIRTTEGVSQQIYSLPHLATLVSTHEKCCRHYFNAKLRKISNKTKIESAKLKSTSASRLQKKV